VRPRLCSQGSRAAENPGRTDALRQQQLRVQERPPAPDAYYDQVLRLFGQGALEGRFAFDANGLLLTAWSPCLSGAPSAAVRGRM